jgi:vacuolar-type H+-ATPase subunit I/STV1|tara:strand:- start:203 stop:421 length:219 start_codon:yes stop_codon:yes gene_type:complete
MTDVARLEVKVMSMCGEIENLQRELKIANQKITELQKQLNYATEFDEQDIREFNEEERKRSIERAKANNVHS